MPKSSTPYRQAAITYLIYGLIYLGGALYLAYTGSADRGIDTRSVVALYGIGGLFILVFPPLIWRGFKWFTRILAVLVGIRVAGLIRVMVNSTGETVPLPWGAELPMAYGAAVFMVVAAVACAMLIRAGWSREATHSA